MLIDIQIVGAYNLDVNRNPKNSLPEDVREKSRQEAAETRKRIVRAAACKFREKGIDATGLADVMKAAGLTHGGFYKHFASKDQLVAEATTAALDTLLEGMAAHPTVNAAVAAYLSTRHRDNPASGCPLAALGGELARSDKKAREAATAGFVRLVDILAGKAGTADARRRALVAAATMIGAVTISRVVTDPGLSAEILRAAEKSLAADQS
ncbi:MAG TPA: TetR family transcriptional regulator [Gemmataceae bacterium]|nr:TetR family transcriptional regulator [Gemmataceae bacterium]